MWDLIDKVEPNLAIKKLGEKIDVGTKGLSMSDLVRVSRDILELAQSDLRIKGDLSWKQLRDANTAIIESASSGTGINITNMTVSGNITVVGGGIVGVQPAESWPEPGKPKK